MIVFVVFVCFSAYCPKSVVAQTDESGFSSSLKALSEKTNAELLDYAQQIRRRSIDSAILITQLAYRNALLEKRLDDQVSALIHLSEFNLQGGNMQKAYEQLNIVRELVENVHDNRILAVVNAGYARIAYIEREFKSCLQHYFEALRYAELTHDSYFIGDLQFKISKIYFALSDYENASYYLNKALRSEYAQKAANLYRLQLNRGNLFLAQNQDDSAFLAYNQSMQTVQKIPNNENDLGAVWEFLAKYHIRTNHLEEAIQASERSIQFYTLSGSLERIATLYTYLAHIYSLRDDYKEALYYNKKALAIRNEVGIKYLIMSSLNNIGSDYIELGNADSAMAYFRKALSLKLDNKSDYYVSLIYKNISKLYIQNGNHELALDYYKLFRDYEDSVAMSKNNKSISEMRIKFELEKEINKSKSLQLTQSRNIQIALIIFSFLLLLLLFLVIRRFREKRKDNQLLQLKNKTINEKNQQLDNALGELKINEQKYRTLADNIPGIVFRLTLKPKENIVFYNKRFTELTGFNEKEFEQNHDRTLCKMILAEDLKLVKEARENAVTQKQPYNIIYRYVHSGSNIKYFNEIGKAVADTPPDSPAIDGVIFDVTDKKITEHELLLAVEKARESDRLKSTFLSTISHELRTPLNAIIGFSNLIDSDTPAELIMDYVNVIRGSGDHLLELVEDLFDISLIETNNLTIHQSSGKIGDTLRLVDNLIRAERKKMIKEEVEINLLVPKDKAHIIYTDLRKLKQILINLLKNALKFTPTGKIDYGFTVEKKGGRTYYQFFVKDTGIGIPANKVNVIFDIFRQVDDTDSRIYEGVGIGLSVVKRYVEMLGGRIWVDTTFGKGSSFFFTLPADIQQEETPPTEALPKILQKKTKTKTILIAEDVPSAFTLLKILLEKEGYNTLWAKNGRQAVEFCQTIPEIQLVLMDLKMPDISGFDATRFIKKDLPNLPIVAQTAYAVEGDREKAMAAGFDEYIEKPIQKSRLFQVINQLFNK